MDLNDFFARLDGELRAEGMVCGPDVWLRVFRLIEQLKQDSDQKAHLADMRQLMLWLRPLFCRNPEEQARFSYIFEQCLTEKSADTAADNRITSTQQAIYHTVREKARKIGIYWWCGGVCALIVIRSSFFWYTAGGSATTRSTKTDNRKYKKGRRGNFCGRFSGRSPND